jgi:serine phosphatase RsbU (regulator of sigma subunit)/predicted enzyme related to lactoylglutathione lyase
MNPTFHLISAASDSPSSLRGIGPALRLGTDHPYLRLAHVTLFVRDHERSLRFYVGRLGFSIIADHKVSGGIRFVAVAPPDGTAILALLSPKPDSEDYKHIGGARRVAFLTENVDAKYHEWRERGVRFHHPPIEPAWGGLFTSFEDPDGNSFVLVGFDETSREVEELRRRFAKALDRERRAGYEIELTREVQRKLLPQKPPELATLDYASQCLPAGLVGGDYYDFLEPAPGQIGFVLADVVGKGLPAALLMANLQAILRTQFRLAMHDFPALLRSVNHLFYENTDPDHYATLFLALYDDAEGTLSYVNCGHPPPLLVRSNGNAELLDGTATVLGLLSEWDCELSETRLLPGDVLLMYTDGVTEAVNHEGEEFGVERLLDFLRNETRESASILTDCIVSALNAFTAGEQRDDITLVLAIRQPYCNAVPLVMKAHA